MQWSLAQVSVLAVESQTTQKKSTHFPWITDSFSPSVIKNLEGWRGKIFLYYYYVKTLSHSWISLNSRMLQLSGQISKYHWTNFTSAGSDDVTTAYWSLFKVSSSSSSSSPNLIFLFSISSSSHSPPAGYRWCSRSSAGVDRSSSPRRCWRSSPPPPLPAPPSTGRSPWVTAGDKYNLGWRTKRAKFNKYTSCEIINDMSH